jgi:hypothetical protein
MRGDSTAQRILPYVALAPSRRRRRFRARSLLVQHSNPNYFPTRTCARARSTGVDWPLAEFLRGYSLIPRLITLEKQCAHRMHISVCVQQLPTDLEAGESICMMRESHLRAAIHFTPACTETYASARNRRNARDSDIQPTNSPGGRSCRACHLSDH